MRSPRLRAVAICLGTLISLTVSAPPAYAVKEFFTELEAKYVNRNSRKRNDVLLSIAFEQAQCTICHPGDDKHKLSRYAGLIAWRVNKFDKDKKKKIQEALEEVGKLQSDPHDPKSPTYNALFKQGRLPPPPTH